MTRFEDKIRAGEPTFGILTKSGGVMMEHICRAGFDYVIIDMMFGDIDWAQAFMLVRAAQARGVFAFIRVQAYPWVGTRIDPRVVVDAAKALSCGANGVCVSVRNKAEVEEIVQCAGDWHRGIPITTKAELQELEKELKEHTWIMPLLETRESIADYEAILDIPGVRAVWPGLSDLAEQLGHGMEYNHPDVMAWARKVSDAAHKRGIAVCLNDGMAYVNPEQKAQRLTQLRELGADMLEFAPVEHLAYIGAIATMSRWRELNP
jgi:2-keto-3-deoxy-L-rhamnonate aldolase RhmA